MKENKSVFISIVVLLCIFLPLSVIGYVNNKEENKEDISNDKHQLIFKGYLWFYNDNDELISKYKCNGKNCKLAISYNEMDKDYKINYYKDGTLSVISPYNNKYAFIEDNEDVILYDIETSSVLTKYSYVKDYNNKIEKNRILIENNESKWGVLDFSETLLSIIPFDYDFIGLSNKLNSEGSLLSQNFIVLKEGKWYIVNDKNEPISAMYNDVIVDFNDNYIILNHGDMYMVYNYRNEECLTNIKINDYVIFDKYIGVISANKLYVYDNPMENYLASFDIIKTYKDIIFKIENNKLNIYLDETILNSIEIN